MGPGLFGLGLTRGKLMCGIAGIVSLDGTPVPRLDAGLATLDRLIAHRGPDGRGAWANPSRVAGLVHRRLAIIDLSDAAQQPMLAPGPTAITYNGEIYNYVELRELLGHDWNFRSTSDTETILAAYDRYGSDCLDQLRGMFAFAIWDERRQALFCARDRFGIKPFYYAVVGNLFVFASEAKALLPFLPEIDTDPAALAEYLTFQYTLGETTLFRGVKQLMPGHALAVENGKVRVWRYWDVRYDIDFEHNSRYFERRLAELLDDAIARASAQRRAGRRLCLGRHQFEPDRDPRRQDRARHRRLLPRSLYGIPRLRRERLSRRPRPTRPARRCTRSTSPPPISATISAT